MNKVAVVIGPAKLWTHIVQFYNLGINTVIVIDIRDKLLSYIDMFYNNECKKNKYSNWNEVLSDENGLWGRLLNNNTSDFKKNLNKIIEDESSRFSNKNGIKKFLHNKNIYLKFKEAINKINIIPCKINLHDTKNMAVLSHILKENNLTVVLLNLTNAHEARYDPEMKTINNVEMLPLSQNCKVLFSFKMGVEDKPYPPINFLTFKETWFLLHKDWPQCYKKHTSLAYKKYFKNGRDKFNNFLQKVISSSSNIIALKHIENNLDSTQKIQLSLPNKNSFNNSNESSITWEQIAGDVNTYVQDEQYLDWDNLDEDLDDIDDSGLIDHILGQHNLNSNNEIKQHIKSLLVTNQNDITFYSENHHNNGNDLPITWEQIANDVNTYLQEQQYEDSTAVSEDIEDEDDSFLIEYVIDNNNELENSHKQQIKALIQNHQADMTFYSVNQDQTHSSLQPN